MDGWCTIKRSQSSSLVAMSMETKWFQLNYHLAQRIWFLPVYFADICTGMGWLHCKETSLPIAQSFQTLCFCTTTISPPFQSTHSIISQSGECKYSRATKITELPTMVYALLSYPLHMFWDLQCTCVLVKGLDGSVLIWTCLMISSKESCLFFYDCRYLQDNSISDYPTDTLSNKASLTTV